MIKFTMLLLNEFGKNEFTTRQLNYPKSNEIFPHPRIVLNFVGLNEMQVVVNKGIFMNTQKYRQNENEEKRKEIYGNIVDLYDAVDYM